MRSKMQESREEKYFILLLIQGAVSYGETFCEIDGKLNEFISCGTLPDVVCTSFVSLLLILVACGVYMIIRVGMIKGSYDILLQEGDYTISEKKLKKKSDAFSGAYWCIATAIYLGWSFWTMRWDFTWIIWPVAGVHFAAVSGIFRAVMQNEKKKIE